MAVNKSRNFIINILNIKSKKKKNQYDTIFRETSDSEL